MPELHQSLRMLPASLRTASCEERAADLYSEALISVSQAWTVAFEQGGLPP